jgi:hypothetical protein
LFSPPISPLPPTSNMHVTLHRLRMNHLTVGDDSAHRTDAVGVSGLVMAFVESPLVGRTEEPRVCRNHVIDGDKLPLEWSLPFGPCSLLQCLHQHLHMQYS